MRLLVRAIAICCFVTSIFILWTAIDAASLETRKTQEAAQLQKVTADLKKAIKIRDFANLKVDVLEKKPLSWGTCLTDVGSNVSLDEMINRLSIAASKTNIIVNEMPVQPLYLTTFETRGWKEDHPYKYFEFKKTDGGWRLLGIYGCDSRSTDFRMEQGEKLLDNHFKMSQIEAVHGKSTVRLSRDLKKILTTKDFQMLSHYVPTEKKYHWGPCGPGDSGSDELSFKKMNAMLLRDSKGVNIYFNPRPNISTISASIESEGWAGEYPFLAFNFKYYEAESRWILNGVCYSARPHLAKKDKKYVPTYFREPQLPRPGQRIFKDYSALHARIEEIVRFKAFDALKPYATKKSLVFGQCNLAMMENDKVGGKEIPVQDVADFLKQNVPSTGEIVPSRMRHKTYYETEGWRGGYPFVGFWFSEGRDGWELAGVSYCKTRHFDLFPPLSPLKLKKHL